jgi:endoglucanase
VISSAKAKIKSSGKYIKSGIKKVHTIKPFNRINRRNAPKVLSIGLVAFIGTILAFASFAAGPFATVVPEQSVITAPGVVVDDTTAVGGKYINLNPSTTTPPPPTGSNPLAGIKFYVDPNSRAKQQADEWRSAFPTQAAQMDKIAAYHKSSWFNGTSNQTTKMDTLLDAAAAQGAVPSIILYGMPSAGCSASGATAYRSKIDSIYQGMQNRKVIVIVEPDDLPQNLCTANATEAQIHYDLFKYAVQTLKQNPNAYVYIDAGHSSWVSASTMATRLTSAGIASADGFSLNVSNFRANSELITYGTQLSGLVGGKHFVLDTARNGLGPTSDNRWCNPPGRALGTPSTANTGNALVDAMIWMKPQGESDGDFGAQCTIELAPSEIIDPSRTVINAAPGVWVPEYALGLAQRASF